MTGRAYPARPLVGIGVAVLRGTRVLLIRRGKPPSAGQWALPGGAQKLGETAEQAARREILEETGVEIGPLHLAAVIDSIHHDAAGAVEYHYTIIDYAAAWTAGEPRAAADATAVTWAETDALGPYDLWSEAHRVIARARALLAPTPHNRHRTTASQPFCIRNEDSP